jgi:DNA-binding transcriptional ArsR family regulator
MVKAVDPDVNLLAALADPARLSIVRQLASNGSVCACDFSACDGLSQPTVSHHLRVLREAGLVHGDRSGTWIWYRLDPSVADRLAAIARGLDAAGPARPASALGDAAAKNRRLPVLETAIPAPAGGRG